ESQRLALAYMEDEGPVARVIRRDVTRDLSTAIRLPFPRFVGAVERESFAGEVYLIGAELRDFVRVGEVPRVGDFQGVVLSWAGAEWRPERIRVLHGPATRPARGHRG